MTGKVADTEQVRSFQADGFVALREFVSGADLRELLTRVADFQQEIVPRLPPEHVFYEDKANAQTLKQIQRMHEYDPWFAELFAGGCFRELAELLLDGPVIPKNLQYFNKPAGVGRPTPPHQDGYYFMLNPCAAVTMWLALEDVDEENGCVRYVRGSHRRGLREHVRTQTLGFSQGIADYPTESDLDQEYAIPARSGDVLVHDALTIHRADGNRSASRTRRALGFVYYSERAREDTEAHTRYQHKLTAEMKAQGKI